MDYWKDVPGINEASGTYQGVLLTPKNINVAFLLGVEVGSRKIKTGQSGNAHFIKKDDLKKINKHILSQTSSVAGAYDFATNEFHKSGIRGVV